MKQKAFTILEIIIVLAIMAMFFAISVPLFSKFTEKAKLDTAARSVTSALRTARSYAITKSSIYDVKFDTSTTPNTYYIRDEAASIIDKKYKLPSGVAFVNIGFTDGEAVFLSTGQLNESNPDTFVEVIDNAGVSKRITVERTTGRTKID